MIEVLILEDDYIWQIKIEKFLNKNPKYKILRFSESLEDASADLKYLSPDIIIADLFLKDGYVLDGFHKIFSATPTLFITNSQEEAVLSNLDKYKKSTFLIKPISETCLISVLEYLCNEYVTPIPNYILIKSPSKNHIKVYYEDIERIVVEGNYSIFFTVNNRKFAKKMSLRKVLDILDNRFIQINKTTIINLNHLLKIDYTKDILHVKSQDIQIGRIYKKRLVEILS